MSSNQTPELVAEKRVQTKKDKKIYCKKGTRRNPKTGVCDEETKLPSSIIKSIKDTLLRIHPTDLSERVSEPLPNNPIIPIQKKRNLVIGHSATKGTECNKNYQPMDTDMVRKEELMALTGPKLRIIHSELINDPSVLGTTPGVKTKEKLVHLIVCLENEKKRMRDEAESEQLRKVAPAISELSTFQNLLSAFSPTEIVERPPTPVPSTIIPLQKSKRNLVIREPIIEPTLDEETKIDIPIEEEAQKPIEGEEVQVLNEPLKITDQEEKLQSQIGIAPSNIESKEYNAFLFNKEKVEKENLNTIQDAESLGFLYPELNDPRFNIKIAKRKEFNDTQYDGTIYDIKEQANKLCDADFELMPHQLFVKNFMSMQTPYNCLLLFMGLGTGKTCSSIGIAEEMRAYMKQIGLNQPILIIASPNVQENYRLQLFDERKLKMVNGLWTSNTCIGNSLLKEINPTNLTGIPKDRILSEVNTIIKKNYTFMGYTELANYIKRHTQIPEAARFSLDQQKQLRIKKIHKYFDNRLIIIDEAHNIRISDDNREDAKTASLLTDVARYANNMRLLMLSATPMYNNYKEIIWLTNLMNTVDKRATIREDDVFDKEGGFLPERSSKDGKKIEGGRELLQRKLTGYVSFVRGENPYTFPLRIYPDTFSPEHFVKTIEKYPSQQLNGRTIEEPLNNTPAFVSQIGEYQAKGYDFIMKHLRNKSFSMTNKFGDVRELPSFENMESFGYTLLMQPLEALNIIFPNIEIDKLPEITPESSPEQEKESNAGVSLRFSPGNLSGPTLLALHSGPSLEPYPEEKNDEIIKNIVGKRGLYNIMTRKEDKGAIPNIYDFEYKPAYKEAKMFRPENIGKYSSKIAQICESVRNSTGIVLIYTQYIEGGVVPIALALEEMGLGRFSVASHAKSLFKEPPVEPIDAITMKPRSPEVAGFQQAKYIMITGNKAFSPDNLADIKIATNPNNKNGEKVKVIIISKAGSEGLDFKYIRQIHILEPWYNMSRIEQIIGRGVRNLSHCGLEFEHRNVEIYLHATIPRNQEEPADLYVYRFAEKKAVMIGRVTRLLKEVAVDCLLNIGQTNLTVEKLAEMAQNKDIKIQLSSKGGEEVAFSIGDKPFSQICDYMDNCAFTCSPASEPIAETDIIQETYNDDFLKMNYSGIVKRIRDLFRERTSYRRDDLITSINILKKYPTSHIDYALSRFVDNTSEYVFDHWGRTGYLINRDDLYVFQPVEISDEGISLFERVLPIQYKREYVEIELPKEKAPLFVEEEEDKTETAEEVQIDYDNIVKRIGSAADLVQEWRTKKSEGAKMASGEPDWYKNTGYVFDTIMENHSIEESDVNLFVVHHFLDVLTFEERFILIKNMYQEGSLNSATVDLRTIAPGATVFDLRPGSNDEVKMPFQEEMKTYFDPKIVTVRGFRTIILAVDRLVESSDDRLKIYIQSGKNEWTVAQPTDRISALKAAIPTSFVPPSKMSRLVGFMQVFRNNDVVFKTLDLQSKLKKGSRCGGEGKKDVMKKINMIVEGDFQYTEENTEDTESGKNLIVKPGMCIIMEMLMRYYNKMGRDDKVWFLDLERSVLSKLVK